MNTWLEKLKKYNPITRLFRNSPKVLWLIVVFVILFFLLLANPARAGQRLSVEAGSAIVRGPAPTVGLTIGCPLCGPAKTDYEFGFQLIGSSDHPYGPQPNAIVAHAAIVDGWKNYELGLGLYAHNVKWAYNCQVGFHLLGRYRFSDHASIQWRHYSTAGSCRPNPGRDLLTFGWRF